MTPFKICLESSYMEIYGRVMPRWSCFVPLMNKAPKLGILAHVQYIIKVKSCWNRPSWNLDKNQSFLWIPIFSGIAVSMQVLCSWRGTSHLLSSVHWHSAIVAIALCFFVGQPFPDPHRPRFPPPPLLSPALENKKALQNKYIVNN